MQNLLGSTATAAGSAPAPAGVGAFVAALLTGRLMGFISARNHGIIAELWVADLVDRPTWGYEPADRNARVGGFRSLVAGVSITLIFVPLSVTTLGELSAEQTGCWQRASSTSCAILGKASGISLKKKLVTRGVAKGRRTRSLHIFRR